MNLDDRAVLERFDAGQVLADLARLPDRLEAGWQAGLALPLHAVEGVERVALLGKGEPAAAMDLLAAYAAAQSPLPWGVGGEDLLPGWVQGERTLAVCLGPVVWGASPAQLRARGCRVITVEGAGEMAYNFGLLLAAFTRLGLLVGAEEELAEAVEAVRAQQSALAPETPVVRNPAKRMAGQFVGRWVILFGPGLLAPVARRWKERLNAWAKALAQSETLSEADRSGAGGLNHPEALLSQIMALFLQAPSLPERSRLRLAYTRQVYMVQGVNTDVIEARGSGRLAHLWTLLQFGEYSAAYLAVANGEDPAPAEVLAALEDELDRGSSQPNPTE